MTTRRESVSKHTTSMAIRPVQRNLELATPSGLKLKSVSPAPAVPRMLGFSIGEMTRTDRAMALANDGNRVNKSNFS